MFFAIRRLSLWHMTMQDEQVTQYYQTMSWILALHNSVTLHKSLSFTVTLYRFVSPEAFKWRWDCVKAFLEAGIYCDWNQHPLRCASPQVHRRGACLVAVGWVSRLTLHSRELQVLASSLLCSSEITGANSRWRQLPGSKSSAAEWGIKSVS